VPSTPIDDALRVIHQAVSALRDGAQADYIPELLTADPEWFGIAVATADGAMYEVGDSGQEFTIQSISKPFAYGLAMEDLGRAAVMARVGVEPTGDAFNSIEIDEATRRPFNPMVNAGAIVTTGLVAGRDHMEPFDRIHAFLSATAGRMLGVDEAVYRSESDTGDRNRAIAYFMRNFGMLDDVDAVLDAYFRQCSVLVTCRDLAVMAATLAAGGTNPFTGEQVLSEPSVEAVLSVMSTCGMYDFAGEWTYTVGLPAKSGVAGGIVAVLPGEVGIGVFSPRLDARGNSVRGIATCQELSKVFGLHQFRPVNVQAGVIKRSFRGDAVRSVRVRSAAVSAVLDREGRRLRVLQLQGDLHFGSAERVVRAVSDEGPGYVILDLAAARLVDPVAHTLFARLREHLEGRGVTLVLCGPATLSGSGSFPDLDSALEWCEDRLLEEAGVVVLPDDAVPLADQALLEDLDRSALAAVEEAVTTRRFDAGEAVFDEGDPGDAVHFLVRGSVSVVIGLADGTTRRVATFAPGVVFGELALLDRGPRSASVIADEAAVVRTLPFDRLDELFATVPGLREAIATNLARMLADRLRRSTHQIRALSR
jgi:glutaminase